MCRTSLNGAQKIMTDLSAVDEAAVWADQLVSRVYRGPGDTIEAAHHRAEKKYGVPAQTFWALRYRRPKDLLASVYRQLRSAYQQEVERQEAKLRHELECTKLLPATPDRLNLIREVEALLGSAPGEARASPGEETPG
jgi:hypothetical protein